MSAATAYRGTVNVAEINPHAPRPYTFTEAALCLRDSIRAAGYASEIHSNRTDANRVSIVLGALPPHLPAVEQLDPMRSVIFNFEQLASPSPIIADTYRPWLRHWLVADYHRLNIEWLQREHGGSQVALELPLVPGPSVAFRPELPATGEVDVLFFGTLNPRRDALLAELRAAGLTVEVVQGAYAQELTPAIKRARLVLHAHYYEAGLFPVARILQPVAQGVPIVCETSVHSDFNDWTHSGIVFAGAGALVQACRQLAASADERAERAGRNRAFAAAIDFASPFEQLLLALARRRIAAPPAPRPLAPPAASPVQHERPQGESGESDGPLSDEAIEAILAREAEGLPPEAHLPAPPVKLVERQPGQGRHGLWIVLLLALFSLFTIWQTMAR